MTPLRRGILIAVVQAALVLSVAGWFLYERETLPRVWVLTTGVDPQLPIRGRYVDLRLVIDIRAGDAVVDDSQRVTYGWTLPRAEGGTLAGELLPDMEMQFGAAQTVMFDARDKRWLLQQPVAFFLSEHEPDPTRLAKGEELWAEVTVPARGAPRPIRLEVRHTAARDDTALAP